MKQYEISSPVRTFTGDVAGVPFRNGTGYVSDGSDDGRAALAYFQRSAYGIREVENGDAPVVVAPPADSAPQPVAGGQIAQTGALAEGPFDPSEHTTAEVLSFLDGASAEVAERTLDAEAAGKNRASITRHREAVLAAKQPTPADDNTPAPADDTKEAGK
ncbi:hypothetical protein ACGFXC_09255 [Streptomyces sp. NPDC048507]|uniref:hypothetical protein n=1 Tax=Streptomyces sp. NPDC048507 TaxID=3365560 RepID=UPI003710AD46